MKESVGRAQTIRAVEPERWNRTLFEALIETARRRKHAIALEDQDREPITYDRLILASFVLGRKLADITRANERVAVLLPNANGVAVAIFALFAYDRVPAMLNFTASAIDLDAACRSVEAETIITSHRFVEAANLSAKLAAFTGSRKVVYLEDVRASIGLAARLRGVWEARHAERTYAPFRAKPGDIAIVLFTSGTERQPKAVALTHANMLANIEQVAASIDWTDDDVLMNPLPVFHAFGLMAGLFLPIVFGFKGILYPSPLHYDDIPKLAREVKPTIMIGIDTFAARWAKSAGPDDFRSIRLMVLGAERVKDHTRELWRDRCGIEILEGYGVTEASPVVAVNRPDHNRPGTVGPLLPGIEMKLEDMEGITSGRRLHIRGPNIMAGYYFPAEPNRLRPPPEGWHDTGDLVTVDADGYLTIVSRAKRFAKIAGEMVSLTAVESFIVAAWPDHAHAVVSIPDDRKGEALVIITTAHELTRDSILRTARAQGATELAVPDRILVMDELPLLGNGKTDYVSLERLAAEKAPPARSRFVIEPAADTAAPAGTSGM
ncbi:MAG: AMP-binding protein [Bauldia sp.]|nr:AMP-binding protein [Bauldia sp.]